MLVKNKNTSIEVLLFVKQASLIKETTNRSRCYVDSVSPCIALNHSLGMRRGRYADFPPLTTKLYMIYLIKQT